MGARTGNPRGRPSGAKNKRTKELAARTEQAAEKIVQALGDGAFDGDAHALLMSVYKDAGQPIDIRIDAAKAAIRYEKPALASVEAKHSGEIATGGIDAPSRAETQEEWLARRHRELKAVGAAAGSAMGGH